MTRVTVCSDLLVYLSDLTPVDVEEQPIVALPRSWQRDKNVTGRPLQLARRVYSKGIGVEARSRLSFDAAQEYQRLVATIGIDAAAGKRGDCEFVVLGDGKELFRRRMRAADSPYQVRVDVGGMNQVTLLVEPGEDLDFGDHADWCEVCLLRPASAPKSEDN